MTSPVTTRDVILRGGTTRPPGAEGNRRIFCITPGRAEGFADYLRASPTSVRHRFRYAAARPPSLGDLCARRSQHNRSITADVGSPTPAFRLVRDAGPSPPFDLAGATPR